MDKPTPWKDVAKIVWKFLIIPSIYLFLMWFGLVIAGFLWLEDFWKSAGIVSALLFTQMIRAEFNKEFFGARNPQRINNAVQEQSEGDNLRETGSRDTERPHKR
jgi:hypothetical protein